MSNKDTIIEALTNQLRLEREGNLALAKRAKREWVGLTDEDLEPMCDDWRIIFGPYVHDFTKAIEAKLKEKNGG